MATEVDRWFLGEHQHSLDAKGRVILPRFFRALLGEGAVMTKSIGDGCLAVYPREDFATVARGKLERAAQGGKERQAARTFFAGAVEIAADKQGRVAIPQHLRDFAELTRDIVVAGVFDHIEIWDDSRFRDRDRTSEVHDFGW